MWAIFKVFVEFIIILLLVFFWHVESYGCPGGSDSVESACNAGDQGLILGLGRFPGRRNSYPLQYSCLENTMNRGAWQAIVHGVAKNGDTTEWLTLLLSCGNLRSPNRDLTCMPCIGRQLSTGLSRKSLYIFNFNSLPLSHVYSLFWHNSA